MTSDATRAVRNLNPLNIRLGDDWRGLAVEQPDPDFCTFTTAVAGFRAAGIILIGYARRHGVRTVRGVIERWAPPEDHNDTEAYIAAVCRKLGIGPDDVVDLTSPDFVPKLMLAMTDVEAGKGHPFSLAEAQEGFAMAVGRG